MAWRPNGYLSWDQIGEHLGRTGGWFRQLRSGRVPCPVPLPEPDEVRAYGSSRSRQQVALYRSERLPEFEDWYRAHVRALAEREIAAMEAYVARRKAEQ